MKFIFFLQINKKHLKDEVDILPAEKRQWFSQIDTLILGVWPGMPKLPKITSYFFAIFQKDMSDGVDFLNADKLIL